jgi:uncharacterized DUF497 family protein
MESIEEFEDLEAYFQLCFLKMHSGKRMRIISPRNSHLREKKDFDIRLYFAQSLFVFGFK